MTAEFLGRTVAIGKRWPYRALNFLPARHLWKYLAWQSGGSGPEPVFRLGSLLEECRRLLIVLPEDFPELLVALPVVQSLLQELPGMSIQLMSGPREADFLGSMFGEERIRVLEPERLFWGEDHFRALRAGLREFRPGLSLNLRHESHPLLQFLLRDSGAPLRVELSAQCHRPFANITFIPCGPANHLKRFLLATQLWEATGRPIPAKWSRIRPAESSLAESAALLAGKGMRPETTCLFLWQNIPLAGQMAVLKKFAAEPGRLGRASSLLVVHSAKAPHETGPLPPEVEARFPCLRVESTGVLLALFASTARTCGMNGALLHLAGLTDAEVEGFFTRADAPYDTSFLNARMQVQYLEA